MTQLTGIEVAREFHRDVVSTLLARHLPGLRYAAGRLGSGSDVLGYDDEMSRDHDWGCRLTVLVDDSDTAAVPVVDELLKRELPSRYRELPVRFEYVDVATVMDFGASRLGVDPRGRLSIVDWLCVPAQGVLEVVAGPVFHDRTSQLGMLRGDLCWYPSEVEKYILSTAWHRLSQWWPILGRAADRGQDVQSRLLAAALVDDLMRLAFLLCRRWAPYGKWREVAFRALPIEPMPLAEALTAAEWRGRDAALTRSAEILADLQRDHGLPTPQRVIVPFWDRPYSTVDDAVARMLFDDITDPGVRRLPFGIGCVEQWVDSVDVLSHSDRRGGIVAAYRAWLGSAPPDARRSGVSGIHDAEVAAPAVDTQVVPAAVHPSEISAELVNPLGI